MNFIKFSKSVSIALHGIAYMASVYPERVNGKTLAEKINVQFTTLQKVFQKLSKAGIVDSISGPKGGFGLLNSEEVNFLDVYKAIEGEDTNEDCPLGEKNCPFKKCVFGNTLKQVNSEIEEYMKDKKLKEYY